MHNQQLLFYILDRSCEPGRPAKKVVNHQKTNPIDDLNNLKHMILINTRMAGYLYKKFLRILVKDYE